jgi:proton-dependent oligopeptide transporter, POT family
MEGATVPKGEPVFDSGGIGGHPRGLITLFFTEMWERFSYYGMRALLILFMVAPLAEGGLGFNVRRAALVYGTYTMSGYMLSIPGGFIADNFLGARRSVLVGGIVIALGHFTLALSSNAIFYAGLFLIVIGTGMLKPNVSSMVGSLYASGDERRDSGFSIFYMGINIGAFLAPIACGILAQSVAFKGWLSAHGFDPVRSWHWGFAAAGVGMMIGLAQYVAGRGRIAHVGGAPAPGYRPWRAFLGVVTATALVLALVLLSDLVDRFAWIRYGYVGVPVATILWFGFRKDVTKKRIAAVLVFFVAAMTFWAIYEQTGSTIALFGETLTDRRLPDAGGFSAFGRTFSIGSPFPASFFQSVNPAFIFLLAPVFAWLWVRLGARQPSSPLKFVLGLGFVALSFLLMVPAARLTAQGPVSPWWIVGMFFLQTVGEMCLSPVGLSVMTKLSPGNLQGLILGVWFLASAFGNKLAGILAGNFTSTDSLALGHFFLVQAAWAGIATLILLSLVPWVKRLMGGVR